MGYKSNNAEEDELLFILRSSHVPAPHAVLDWIQLNWETRSDDELRKAFEVALNMKEVLLKMKNTFPKV